MTRIRLFALFCALAALPFTAQAEKETPRTGTLPAFVVKGVDWLAAAQHESGGWGAGSHARQQIRDPRAVVTDPATTAFAGVALLRAGHTPTRGRHKEVVRRATLYLVKTVEAAPEKGPRITDRTGTQPQAKMGPLVDTPMTLHFLARVLREINDADELYQRVDAALEKCIRKVQASQQADGSWSGGGGWAPVLQSSLGCSGLELARAAGKDVDAEALARARKYQQDNVDADTGKAKAGKAAGIELYAFAGGARGAAGQTNASIGLLAEAKREGRLERDAPMSVDNLVVAGLGEKDAQTYFEAWKRTTVQIERLDDENLLKGFGNNGGEEFLSYLMTSESLVILGGEKWKSWDAKMHERLGKIQANDGSWSGHHCITSPVFCTAAVVQTLTTERDAKLLQRIAAADRKIASKK